VNEEKTGGGVCVRFDHCRVGGRRTGPEILNQQHEEGQLCGCE
jgi:hypothetical protein